MISLYISNFNNLKKLILYLSICALTLFIADLGLSLIFDYLYKRTKTGQTGGKINYYLSSASPANILIMGNSRSLYQIIPDSIGHDVFNLSHAGMGPAFQTGLLSILIHQAKMPDTILLHLEPYDFIGDQSNRDIQNLKYYYGKDSLVTQLINKINPTEKYKFIFQLYRYNGRVISLVKNFIQTNNSIVSSNGYEPLFPQPSDSSNTLYSSQTQGSNHNAPFNRDQFELLIDFIQMCRHQNTELICFTSPIYTSDHEFRSVLDSITVNLNKTEVPYINFIDSPIELLEKRPSLWRDANHLNHNGAQIESQALKNSIEKFKRTDN